MDLAELLALELSNTAIEGKMDSVYDFVWDHKKTQHMFHGDVDKLIEDVRHVMNNRIILKLKGN